MLGIVFKSVIDGSVSLQLFPLLLIIVRTLGVICYDEFPVKVTKISSSMSVLSSYSIFDSALIFNSVK